tara:strand:+ start:7356 stop:8327 length:972 start_codon:yes stop_codon:yes gene_type:complete
MRNHLLRAAAGNVGAAGVIKPGAVMHWDFGDSSCWNRTNSTVLDLSGNSRNAAIKNYNSSYAGLGQTWSHSYNSANGGYLEASATYTNEPYYTAMPGVSVSGSSASQSDLFRIPSGGGTHNLWWSTSSSLAAYTLEFIYDAVLPRIGSTGAYSNKTTSSSKSYIGYSTGSLYEFHTYGSDASGNFTKPVMGLFLGQSDFAEIGFTGTDNDANGAAAWQLTNSHPPYANFSYSGSNTGWEQVIVTRDTSGNLKMYRNKNLFYSVTSNTDYYQTHSAFFIQIFSIYSQWFAFQGKWGVMRGYDQSFTQADVTSQYNAQKSRFGLP